MSAAKRSRRAIFLTGTPSLSRPYDLFRQASKPPSTRPFPPALSRVSSMQQRKAAARWGRLPPLSGSPSFPLGASATARLPPPCSAPPSKQTQVDALRPGLLGATRAAFAVAYCARRLLPVRSHGGETVLKADNAGLARGPELNALLRREVMLRRLKRDVLPQLPPKRRQARAARRSVAQRGVARRSAASVRSVRLGLTLGGGGTYAGAIHRAHPLFPGAGHPAVQAPGYRHPEGKRGGRGGGGRRRRRRRVGGRGRRRCRRAARRPHVAVPPHRLASCWEERAALLLPQQRLAAAAALPT